MQDRYTAKGWKKSWRSNTSHNGEYRVKRLVSSLKIDFILANKVSPYLAGRASMQATDRGKNMRYILSVAQHVLAGKLTIRHAIYALRVRPVAVASKGQTWIIDPTFEV